MTHVLLAVAAVLTLASPQPIDRETEKLRNPPPDWISNGEFKGKSILMVDFYGGGPLNFVPDVIRKLGFTVEVQLKPKHLPKLDGYDQLWVVSNCGSSSFDASDVAKVKAFADHGKGLYVLTDNVPCVYEGNLIGKELHNIQMTGDYIGEQLIHVVVAGAVQKMIDEAKKTGDLGKLAQLRRAGYLNGKLYAEDHELLSGIERIYEGVTICHLSDSPDLEVILRASDNQSLVAVSKKKGENLLYDCGFTRMYNRWEESKETSSRWYQNVAAYLAGKRRTDLATR